MNNLIQYILCTSLAMSLCSCAAHKEKEAGTPLKLIVASDLHYISPDLTDHGSLFTQLIETSDGKAMNDIEEITDSFINEVIEQNPDALLLSGDLSFNGGILSHRDLIKKLKKVKQAGIPVLVIPGNHDEGRYQAYSFKGDKAEKAETATAAQFRNMYEDFGLKQAKYKAPDSFSYVYALRTDLWLLAIDSNSHWDNIIDDNTLQWSEGILQKAKEQNVKVITMTHQNLLNHVSMYASGFQISNASDLIDLVKGENHLLNLSGHMHLQHITTSSFNDITDIATSSLAVYPHHYGIVDIDGDSVGYQTGEVPVSTDTKTFFYNCAKQKTLERLAEETDIPDTDKEIMADTFAALNQAYFIGKSIPLESLEEGIQTWKNYPENFSQEYILYMTSEMRKGFDYTSWHN